MSQAKQQLIIEAQTDALQLILLQRVGTQLQCVDHRQVLVKDADAAKCALHHQVVLDEAQSIIESNGWTRGTDWAFLIGGSVTACHYFTMPALSAKEMADAVKLKLAQQMHFPIGDAIVDVQSLSKQLKDSGNVLVRATALRHDVSDAAVGFATSLGVSNAMVTTYATALHALADITASEASEPHATLFIDRATSVLMVSGSTGPLLTTELPLGEREFVTALMRPIIAGEDMVQLDEAAAEQLWHAHGIPSPNESIEAHDLKGRNLLPLLEPVLQRFSQQLIQWLTFASTTDGGVELDRVALVGPYAHVNGIADALAGRLNRDIAVVDWLAEVGLGHEAERDAGKLSAACGAILNSTANPNLITPTEKQARRMRRLCKSTTIVGPLVAAAALGFAFLINHTSGGLQAAVGNVDLDMARLKEVQARNEQVLAQRQTVERMQGELDTFAAATPNWLGLLKELSFILPEGVAIERLTGRQVDGQLRIAIQALAIESTATAGCDRMIEQTLRAMEESPFSKAVHLINVSRSDPNSGQKTARLNVEIELVYRGSEPPNKEVQP